MATSSASKMASGALENRVKKVETSTFSKDLASIQRQTIDEIVSVSKELPEDVVRWKPAEDKWSILQVFMWRRQPEGTESSRTKPWYRMGPRFAALRGGWLQSIRPTSVTSPMAVKNRRADDCSPSERRRFASSYPAAIPASAQNRCHLS